MAEDYLGLLDVTTPPGSAFLSNADDVMRAIKRSAKQSFPNVTGAVTLTHSEINALPGTITNAQSALKSAVDPHGYTTIGGAALATVVPKGGIIMWAPSMGTIPTGWRLCDGGTYNGVVTPDLRSKFIFGEPTGFSGTRDVGESVTLAATGAHTHSGNTGSTTLTIAQMPAHDHRIEGSTNGAVATINEATAQGFGGIKSAGSGLGWYSVSGDGSDLMEDTGGGGGHTHTISSDGGHTHTATNILPRHYILAFICYVGA